MGLIQSGLLDGIDRLKQSIIEGGLEKCLETNYCTIAKMSQKDAIYFDEDNAEYANQISPHYKEASHEALKLYDGIFTPNLMQRVAALVEPVQSMHDGYADYRNGTVTISALKYVPPIDKESIRSSVDDVIKYIKNSALHPVEEAALLYFHIIRIQPFAHGNKRTGSIMMNTTLHYNGYPSLSFKSSDKNTFYSLLKNAIDEYREAEEEEKTNRIGYKQRAFFEYIGHRVENTLKGIHDKFASLDKYVIQFKKSQPGQEFTVKNVLNSYFKKNAPCCYNVHLDRINHRILLTADMSLNNLEKIMSHIGNIHYDIKDLRDVNDLKNKHHNSHHTIADNMQNKTHHNHN